MNIKYFTTLILFVSVRLGALGQVPDNLTSTRSAVVISIPSELQNGFAVRGDWKKAARSVHASFRKIGVDAIVYLHKDDLTAGPEIIESYTNILSSRRVANVVEVVVSGSGYNLDYELNIFRLQGKIDLSMPFYSISSKTLEDLMLLLGRQVLRQEIVRSNFLIPEGPEYLDDLVLYTGTRFPNVPSRLKSTKLAVIVFDSLDIPDGLSEMQAAQLQAENRKIAKANKDLKKIMEMYPLKYELVKYEGVDQLYKDGFQYALFPLSSSGKTIKQMLNYPTSAAESVVIREVVDKQGKETLTKMPANSKLTKYYIKQTIASDLHVGKRWDADVTWQKSLENFIQNLKFDLKVD